jgi:hypothetical protein
MNKKKLTIAAATLVALTLIITGTFAWISLANSTTSGLIGKDAAPGASTHDDIGLDGFDKDVYVENWGTEPLFVRVKLSEYMEVGSLAGTDSPDKKVEKLVDYSSYEDPDTWSLYFYGIDTPFREFWTLNQGGSKVYKPVAPENQVEGFIANDPNTYDISDPGVKETLFAGVMSMQDWASSEPASGKFWVGDEDGWFYWAQALQPGEATGLLVDSIEKLKNIPGGTYYYGIHTETQMATGYGDIETPDYYINFGDSENGGWTPEASDLLGFIVAKADNAGGAIIVDDPTAQPGAADPSSTPYAEEPVEVEPEVSADPEAADPTSEPEAADPTSEPEDVDVTPEPSNDPEEEVDPEESSEPVIIIDPIDIPDPDPSNNDPIVIIVDPADEPAPTTDPSIIRD